MNNKNNVHIAGMLCIAIIFIFGYVLSAPEDLIVIYISSFGMLALLSIVFVMFIPLIVRLKNNKFTIALLVNRRWIGIYTFIFALIHVLLVANYLFQWDTAILISNPYNGLGLIAFVILILMTATSNNKSVSKLGKNWKKLHTLVYIALILLVVHSLGLGLVFMGNTLIQSAVILLAAIAIILKLRHHMKRRKAMAANKANTKNEAS